MAKYTNDDVMDAALNVILNNANIMTACNAQPTTRTEAVTTYALADVAMAPADFTLGNGDTNGRKIAVAQKAGVTVDTTGTAIYIALCDATRLLDVTTCTSQVLTAANTVTFPTWDHEISDPT